MNDKNINSAKKIKQYLNSKSRQTTHQDETKNKVSLTKSRTRQVKTKTSTQESGHKNSENSQDKINDQESSDDNSKPNVNLTVTFTRNVLLLELFERKTPALIDSGASVSCIQKSVIDKLMQKQNLKIYQTRYLEVTGVGGEHHSVTGAVQLPVKISGVTFEQEFLVIKELHHPLILGLDFMTKNRCAIDFHYNVLSIMSAEISVALTRDSKFGYARCIKPEIVPANSEVTVNVRISGDHKNETLLLDPAENLQGTNIVGARCLVTTKNSKALMRLANPTDEDIYLSPKGILANVHLVENSEVYTFEDEDETIDSGVESVNNININSQTSESIPDYLDQIDLETNNQNLTSSQKQKLQDLLIKNKDVFSTSLKTIGKTGLCKHTIDVYPDAVPVRSAPYRQDPIKRAETEKQTNEFVQSKIAQRSTSVWNSPVILVKKKDGSWRFAVDYRKLNKVTKPISQPLPRLEDVFDSLGESKATVFSTLDLNSAYFQMELDPETREKSAFVTHEGVFEFLRMPFGLRNAPMSFQLLMSHVLKGQNWKFVLVYIDDILVFSKDFDTHMQHLNEVFQRLREANLTLKPSKCQFGVNKVMFLGHILSANGVNTDPSKIDKIQNFPVPATQKELRGFLGLCNYYRRFVKDIGKITAPLNALLKKEVGLKFKTADWADECQHAFETLKHALLSPPILRFPDMNREFILSTDASGSAISYILGQKDENNREYVICYGGRSLSKDERKWDTYEKECLAIVSGVRAYKHYLSHRHFTIYTDNNALKWLWNKKEPTGKFSRWCLDLQSFNFDIIHKPGLKNQNADALSRIDYERLNEQKSQSNQSDTNHLIEKGKPKTVNNAEIQENNNENLITVNYHPKSELTDKEQENKSITDDRETEFQQCNETCDCQTSSPDDTNHRNEKLNSTDKQIRIEARFEYDDIPVINVTDTSEPEMLDIGKDQRECSDFQEIIQYLETRELPADQKRANTIAIEANNQYVLSHGILYHLHTPRSKKGKDVDFDKFILQLAVPKSKRKDILLAYHDCQAGGGHFGHKKTYYSIRDKYFWPQMYDDIEKYVKTCDTCQRTKIVRNKAPPPLTPLPIGEPFSRVHIDILGPLPKTKQGYQYILLIVDSFSKWTEAFPLATQEAKDIAEILYNEIFTRYGAPRTIVSDRGKNFMSKLVNALCEMFEVKRHHTSSYHPQTNATCERRNSTLIQTMRAYVSKDQMNWPLLLPSIMMAFRAVPCESTGYSPHELLFGRKMHLPIDTNLIPKTSLGQNVQQYFEQLIERLRIAQEIARSNMTKQQDKSKARHDLHAKTPTFKLGDKVMLKHEKVEKGLSPKFVVKWIGPYEIIQIGPNYTYKLKNLQNDKIVQSLINACKLKLHNRRGSETTVTQNQANEMLQNTQANDMLQNNQQAQMPEQNATQQPVQDKTKNADPANDEYMSALNDDIRIINASRQGPKQWYRVLWPDNTKLWILEPYVNKTVINDYLQTHTKQGRIRKFKLKCFTKSDKPN